MTVVETAVEDLFVGLENAEVRHDSDVGRRATQAAVAALILGVEIGWLAAFAYAAYMFVF